jgi:hypothetical protein
VKNDNEIYSNKMDISGDAHIVGFKFKAGKYYAKGQFDNIKIYCITDDTDFFMRKYKYFMPRYFLLG